MRRENSVTTNSAKLKSGCPITCGSNRLMIQFGDFGSSNTSPIRIQVKSTGYQIVPNPSKSSNPCTHPPVHTEVLPVSLRRYSQGARRTGKSLDRRFVKGCTMKGPRNKGRLYIRYTKIRIYIYTQLCIYIYTYVLN